MSSKTIKEVLINLSCENFNRGVIGDDTKIDRSIDQALLEIQEIINMNIGDDSSFKQNTDYSDILNRYNSAYIDGYNQAKYEIRQSIKGVMQ